MTMQDTNHIPRYPRQQKVMYGYVLYGILIWCNIQESKYNESARIADTLLEEL